MTKDQYDFLKKLPLHPESLTKPERKTLSDCFGNDWIESRLTPNADFSKLNPSIYYLSAIGASALMDYEFEQRRKQNDELANQRNAIDEQKYNHRTNTIMICLGVISAIASIVAAVTGLMTFFR